MTTTQTANDEQSHRRGRAKAPPTVGEIAARCLDQNPGDIRDATTLMFETVIADPALYRALMDPLVRNACYNALTKVCRERRQQVWRAPAPVNDLKKQAKRVGAMGEDNLMHFLLPGGQFLGDATAVDVDVAAQFYLKQARNMHDKGIWLQLIRRALGSTRKPVAAVLSEETLWDLRRQAERDTNAQA
jgi:hypothetical protein